MKEYKYKINGNSYKVTIGDIEDNIAHVEVNGTGCYTRHKSERRRHSEERTNHYYIGSHENGKQYQCRQRR